MDPVEVIPVQEALVLRARGSELLIMPHHVRELKERKAAEAFSQYFTNEALLNRPARKLFFAWLRKDGELWRKIYRAVQEIEVGQSEGGDAPEKPEKPAPEAVSKPKKTPKAEAAPPKKAAEKKAESKKEKETKEKKGKPPAAAKKASDAKPEKSEKKAKAKPKK